MKSQMFKIRKKVKVNNRLNFRGDLQPLFSLRVNRIPFYERGAEYAHSFIFVQD